MLRLLIRAVLRRRQTPRSGLSGAWRKDSRGNVAIITAVMLVPLTMGLGMGVDYGVQRQRQDQLAGVADATALFALNPNERALPPLVAQLQAQQFWNAQTASISGITGVSASVIVTDSAAGSASSPSVVRNVKVTFTGASNNFMSTIVGSPTLPLNGSSTANSAVAPRINFYLLVDTSPSMAIAATTAGISTMVSNTSAQGGCAFGCHETNPTSGDTVGNPINPATGQPGDNYYLAHKLGVTLRIDLVNQAVTNLLSLASSTANKNNTTYGVSVSTIDYQVGQLYQTNDIYANLAAAQTRVGTLQQLAVAYNGCVLLSNCNANNAGNDQDSALDLGVSTLGNPLRLSSYSSTNTPGFQMFTPGQGTTNAGDSPQEVLFIVSDGVIDEYYSGGRKMDPINTLIDNCTTIKNSGIRIAFLYLTYNPLPTNSFYNDNIAPFQTNIGPAAQACASPGLYTEVNTGGDISAALANLFQVVVATAHLTS